MGLPELKPRDSARVILADPEGRVLLFECLGLARSDASIWLTPGGGVEDDESLVEAAARELAEETGIVVAPSELGPLVASSSGRWATGDGLTVFQGTDWYFFARTEHVQVDTAAHTVIEREFLLGHRWWSAEELRRSAARIYPVGLGDLLVRLLAGDLPDEPVRLPWESDRERIEACLVAGAVGDAFGHAVEFNRLDEIRRRFGPEGIVAPESTLITDDTQMTLFTAEGLLRAAPGDEVASVHRAYRAWLATQTLPAPPAGASGLAAEPWLYARRAPGNACLTGLRHEGPGPINPNSKGCGTVMRSAPFGLLGYGSPRAFSLAAECARLTHGHPTAAVAAGSLAVMIDELIAGAALGAAVGTAIDAAAEAAGGDETVRALRAAVAAAGAGAPSAAAVERLGEGWIAEEALAIATYAALVADQAAHGLALAVNHSGDSDSTGAICGNILGAAHGLNELPPPWTSVEGRAVIAALATRLADRRAAPVTS